MNIRSELSIAVRLLGMTQEEAARRLGVSFVTFNSWVRGRSLPRRAAQQRIHRWYKEVTGREFSEEDPIAAKKAIVRTRSGHEKCILKKILSSPDILDQLTLSVTYNSNGIEGSTLTEQETAAVLFDNVALPNKSLVEQIEAKNHQAAVLGLFQHIAKGSVLDDELVLRFHGVLMNGIRDDAGRYRTHAVRIVGSNVPTANPLRVPVRMREVMSSIQKRQKDTVEQMAVVHARFEQVHPFSDGNGRVGRLLLHAMALKANLPPVVIRQREKRRYYRALQSCQLKGDTLPLQDLICDGLLDGYRILARGKP